MEDHIRSEITRFVRESPANRFADCDEPYFDEPLVGYAAAGDPIFSDYKTIIGDFHQTPQEVAESVFGDNVQATTVISWILPITRATRESNRGESVYPSQRWARTRNFGEPFNTALRRHLAAHLEGLGFRAVAPQLAPGWRSLEDPSAGLASTWSERHAAFAAGLGTFSLNGGLITARGIAHRIGSLVTDLPLVPTPRPYTGWGEWCPFLAKGSCGACISRCPVNAVLPGERDKVACHGHVYGTVPAAVAQRYGVTETGCGLCQTNVPCEERIPAGAGTTAG
jgi:epoxyqueuosine reductase QueG